LLFFNIFLKEFKIQKFIFNAFSFWHTHFKIIVYFSYRVDNNVDF
jgi:hypothetical protein